MLFKLKDKLEDRGVSQYQLAKAVGVSQPSVNAWLKGRVRKGQWSPVYPDYETLEKICLFLDVPIEEMLVLESSAMQTTYRDFSALVAA